MYQNRPICWLRSSGKGAFKCLAYMHRMNAYTAENRKPQNLQKALDECREYHECLQVVAEQAIAFDLDDGVVFNYAKFGDVLSKLK